MSTRDPRASVQASLSFLLVYARHDMIADTLSDNQLYAIIVLPNGGPDLEAFSFTKPSSKYAWRQACSVFWQVTKSLATAEELVCFEVSLFTYRSSFVDLGVGVPLQMHSIGTSTGDRYWLSTQVQKIRRR